MDGDVVMQQMTERFQELYAEVPRIGEGVLRGNRPRKHDWGRFLSVCGRQT